MLLDVEAQLVRLLVRVVRMLYDVVRPALDEPLLERRLLVMSYDRVLPSVYNSSTCLLAKAARSKICLI